MSKFYEDLIKNSFSQKTASEQNTEEVKEALENFSTEQIEALAEELGNLFEKEAADETVEKKVMRQPDQEEKKNEDVKKNDAKVEKSEGENPKDEREATDSEETEEAKTKAETAQNVNTMADKSASEEIDELLKESAEEQEAIMKEAYDVAERELAEQGIGLADYVFAKVANEAITNTIVDKAEKLAFLTGKNALQVADDIIFNINALCGEEE